MYTKNKKLGNILKNIDKGFYKNCYIKLKLDKKGHIVKIIMEHEIDTEEERN